MWSEIYRSRPIAREEARRRVDGRSSDSDNDNDNDIAQGSDDDDQGRGVEGRADDATMPSS